MPAMIPPTCQDDRDRDPEEDYEYGLKLMRVPASALHAWIRRAVAAETKAKGHDQLLAVVQALPGVLCDVCQLLDGWHNDGTAWTVWDEGVRRRASELMRFAENAMAASLAPQPVGR